MTTMYEGGYYLMKETKQPKYLDFYDLKKEDLAILRTYIGQTVRYKKRWFFVTHKTKLFYSFDVRDNYPENWIKYLYKKPEEIKEKK